MLDHGQRALRIGLPAIDLSTKVGLQEVKGMIKKHRPKVLWISLPCGSYSPIQKLFNEDTPEKKEKSLCANVTRASGSAMALKRLELNFILEVILVGSGQRNAAVSSSAQAPWSIS
jgi:hypothetical protein